MYERNILVGYQNGFPSPEFEAEIRALGDHLGRELGPDDYPYNRRDREVEPASLAP